MPSQSLTFPGGRQFIVLSHLYPSLRIQYAANSMRNLLFLLGLMALTVGASAQVQSSFSSPSQVSANDTSSNSVVSKTASRPATATADIRTQPYDPLVDLPPLPHNQVSLIGGIVINVDKVLNRITIQPFGSKQDMRLAFDIRSQIKQDGEPATARDIRPGERVYIDSILDGSRLFAKSISIHTLGASGIAYGQVLGYDAGSRTLSLMDELSDKVVHFRLSPATVMHNGSGTCSPADLKPGSLVSVDFGPQQGIVVAREISLLAETGTAFLFLGKITFVDLARKLIAIENQSDGKTYEIHLASIAPDVIQDLHQETEVSVWAVFDGTQYTARSVTPTALSQPSAP